MRRDGEVLVNAGMELDGKVIDGITGGGVGSSERGRSQYIMTLATRVIMTACDCVIGGENSERE